MHQLTIQKKSTTLAILGAALAAWFATVIFVSSYGILQALGEIFMPGFAILVVIAIAIPTLTYFSSSNVKKVIDQIGIRRLTLFHTWRIAAGLFFLYYAYTNQLPIVFALIAGIGDILAGLAASRALARNVTISELRRIHQFGFLDFVSAVSTGLTFTLIGDPLMQTLTTLPMALIPLFGVGLSGSTHIICLTLLKNDK